MVSVGPKKNRDGYKQVTFSIEKENDIFLKMTKVQIELDKGLIIPKSEIVNRLIRELKDNPKLLNKITK